MKLKNLSRRRSILGDSRWPSSAQAGPTSELHHEQLEDGNEVADERDLSAELARYWDKRKQMEASMLWTLSDLCTHFIQPVLTTERIILPDTSTEPNSASTPLVKPPDLGSKGNNATSSKFSKAFAPLVPLVTPPRRPSCALSSGTMVYVADPKTDPLHPIN
jgi:hypothetical protein